MNTKEIINFAQAFDKPVIENNRIEDADEWQTAMRALDDAIDVVSSATYFRISVRDDAGVYHNIPQAMSDVEGV